LDGQLNLLTTWLSHSKNCSLSLSCEIEHPSPSSIFPLLTAVLISQSERWEHIKLIIPFDDLRWLNRSFPLLCDLNFGANNYSGEEVETAAILFRNAPALKSVVLGKFFNPAQVVLPWSQLTSITVEWLATRVAADILWQATALVNFTCTIWGSQIIPAIPPLLALESLTLRGDAKLLLKALTAPALQHLTTSEIALGHGAISIIAEFLSRSRSSLQSLHISWAHLPNTDYYAAFPSIPIIDIR
jgi:hypothetical protein